MKAPETNDNRRKEGYGDRHEGSRALVGAAVAATVLYVVSVMALGTPPRSADTGLQVVDWFREHRDGVRWSVWALTVMAPLLALVFALLRRLLPAPHRDVFLIGAIVFLGTTAVQAWTWGGLALHVDQLEPGAARTVLDVAVFWGPVLTGATITMMAPVTLLALGGNARLPRWLGLLGVLAIAEQAIETVTVFGSTGFTEPGGAMNLQLGAGLVAVWLLAFALWGGLRGYLVLQPQ
ncbi:MAG TPA: hypothetical protein DEP35_20115 [Deltaproteobacteria bacterium]|jgi:hypothetical protein|nr:hypothetical protein [Deltaproteobacteria bacterium]